MGRAAHNIKRSPAADVIDLVHKAKFILLLNKCSSVNVLNFPLPSFCSTLYGILNESLMSQIVCEVNNFIELRPHRALRTLCSLYEQKIYTFIDNVTGHTDRYVRNFV
jgi:hypothetical protein